MKLEWTAHPAKKRPQDVMLAACVITLTAWAVLVSLGSPWLALIAAVILVASISPFLLPTHYRLDEEGVQQRRLFVTRARPWRELQRVDIGPTICIVSPYRTPRWLDRYRGIVVMLDGAEHDAVIDMLTASVATRRDDEVRTPPDAGSPRGSRRS